MLRITSLWLLALLAVLSGASACAAEKPRHDPSSSAVFESTSTGLITFAEADRAIRVAVAFAAEDDAEVTALVRFIDARGRVLKQERGTLREGQPVIAELARQELGSDGEILLRAQVMLKLPGLRHRAYPIVVTLQPIAKDGFGRFLASWPSGGCGCPTCAPPLGGHQHADCVPPPSGPGDLQF